jgi:DNA-binding CsgD family transcriptional regulator
MAALKQAAATHRLPWAAASATEDMAALLAETNPDAGAEIEQALSQCLADYEQIGACHDAERVRERLRRLGHGNQRRHHDRRPVSGWASLTDTQLKVADLVAQGLTNPEVARQMFLSRHTVDFHLRQIYRKLAIGSRVELTRLSIERDRMLGVVQAR